MTESCVLRLESKKQLKEIEKEFPFVVKAFLSDKSDRCDDLKPRLERECQETDKIVPFKVVPTLHCPVEKKFCKDELVDLLVDDYKKRNGITKKLSKKETTAIPMGIPAIFGQSTTNKNHFMVLGNEPEELGLHYSKIRELLEKTKQDWVKRAGK